MFAYFFGKFSLEFYSLSILCFEVDNPLEIPAGASRTRRKPWINLYLSCPARNSAARSGWRTKCRECIPSLIGKQPDERK